MLKEVEKINMLWVAIEVPMGHWHSNFQTLIKTLGMRL